MLNKRRDPLIVDTVQLAQDDTEMYTPVNRDGTIADADGDAFGITMDSGGADDFVSVCRLGFCPLIAASATTVNGEKIELIVAANGQVDSADQAAGDAFVIGVSEEAASADGSQIGAWVDCLSAGRERAYGV